MKFDSYKKLFARINNREHDPLPMRTRKHRVVFPEVDVHRRTYESQRPTGLSRHQGSGWRADQITDKSVHSDMTLSYNLQLDC